MFTETHDNWTVNTFAETTDGGETWVSKPFNNILVIKNMMNRDDGTSVMSATGTFTDEQKELFKGLSRVGALLANQSYYNVENLIDGKADGKLYATQFPSTPKYVTTTDGGETWTKHEFDADKYMYTGVFLDANNGIIAGRQLTLYRTTDGGTTWTKIVHGAGEGLNSIYCKNRNECFAGGLKGRMFSTKDGGANWTWQDIHNDALNEIEFPTPDTGYVAANLSIFRTIDGGSTWTKFAHNTRGNFIEFPTKDIGYIGYPSGTPSIHKTVNAGDYFERWVDYTYVENKTSASTFCFRNALVGLTTGKDKLIFTTDGGTTWNTKDVDLGGSAASGIIDLNNKEWLVFNSVKRVYKCDENFDCYLKYIDLTPINGYRSFSKRDSSSVYAGFYSYTEDSKICDSALVSYNGGETWQRIKDTLNTNMFFAENNVAFNLAYVQIHKRY